MTIFLPSLTVAGPYARFYIFFRSAVFQDRLYHSIYSKVFTVVNVGMDVHLSHLYSVGTEDARARSVELH